MAKSPKYYSTFLKSRNADKKKIGIVGSSTYENRVKIRETIWKLIQKYGKEEICINTGGNPNGADSYVKDISLEFGVEYEEFNPSHTKKNKYSVMNSTFYNKEFNTYNYTFRNDLIVMYSDFIIAFLSSDSDNTAIRNYIKLSEKYNKPLLMINDQE